MKNLNLYGFKNFNVEEKTDALVGRVISQQKHFYQVVTDEGVLRCTCSGKFVRNFEEDEFPVVGDWLVVEKIPQEEKGLIQEVFERKSELKRTKAGVKIENQILASNMDFIFLLMSMNYDFNLRRLERQLIAARNSHAEPVIVLTKSDLCKEPELYLEKLKTVSKDSPTFVVSSVTGNGVEELKSLLSPDKTAVCIGSSGVGKSSLINLLLGQEKMKVQGIREDDSKGRHTTTHREMFLVPTGGIIIDTPGMREFKLANEEEGVEVEFEDILNLAKHCRFRNCSHQNEPGCAVRAAVESGELSEKRLKSYFKLKNEAEQLQKSTKVAKKKKEHRKYVQKKNYQKGSFV
jgi:ribosome biogenesis GTPase